MPASEYPGDELPIPPEKTLFGKYELGRLLGYGAFAKVFLATHVHTEHSVAVKIISKQRILKGGLVDNVKREISIMRKLHHPNIIRLDEVLADKKKIYFVLEYAQGGELFAKLRKSRFTEDLSRRYFQQLISAVGYCHSRGIYHRDLKPENLLLDERWNLKVTDFGLSALTDQIRPDGLLHTSCGTPAYVAPEILSKKGYDGAKIDIWSCGIILFVLNAGYLPFNDSNLMILYRRIYTGEFRVPRWTSPGLKRLLFRLLDTNPDTRITVDEIISDPWFKIGYKEVKFHHEYHELKSEDEGDYTGDFNSDGDGDGDEVSSISTSSGDSMNLKVMNAFDIISFSSGYNLSGLFDDEEEGERFLSTASPEKIIETVVTVAETEGLMVVTRKDWCVKVVGGHNRNFIMMVELKRLTEQIVVVEVRVKEIEVGPCNRIWKNKIRPGLSDLKISNRTG